MSNELDGTYLVSSTTSYQGPLEKKSDGVTEIKDGQTARVDGAGCQWTSTFTLVGGDQVEMVSVADPSNADADFMLTRPDGTPTRDAVTYKTMLKYARIGEKVQLSGQIEYGDEIVFLTMRKK